eukprot:114856_1
MPVNLNQLTESLVQIGTDRLLAAQRMPYTTNTAYGFDHTARNAGSALLASMVVYHESADLAFVEVEDDEIIETKQAWDAAKTALENARRAGDQGQNQQMPVLQDTLTTTRKAHFENEYKLMIKR